MMLVARSKRTLDALQVLAGQAGCFARPGVGIGQPIQGAEGINVGPYPR